MRARKFSIWNILIVLIVIALFVVWVMSLGQVSSNEISRPNEFKEDREQAKRKHKWYKIKLRGQKKLKEHLEKKLKLIYFGMRLGLFLLWGGIIIALYLVGLIASLIGVFGYTAGISGCIIGATYLSTGTYYDLKELADILKIRTENWVYGKYLDLDERIESSELKIEELDSKLQMESPK
jgi:Ca2+/Na+ antiporter